MGNHLLNRSIIVNHQNHRKSSKKSSN
jgi:hypothetical protein